MKIVFTSFRALSMRSYGLRALGLLKLVNKANYPMIRMTVLTDGNTRMKKGTTKKLGYDRGLNDYSLFKELFHYESYKTELSSRWADI